MEPRISFARPVLWGVFVLFLIVSGYAVAHHELWGDEIHSWNISKGSEGLFDLINNSRYEGHPPVWYTILWTISKFTHNPSFIQLAQFVISGLVVFIVLFLSTYPIIIRILIPFGYFFLFEYGIFARNYAIGVLLAFCICYNIKREFRGKLVWYYILLFLLSNTHLLGMILASSLHCYFLILRFEQKKKIKNIFTHILTGALILLPSLYFIVPPSDGELNIDFWLNRWNTTQFVMTAHAPLRSFIPIPAWWQYHFWNTQFLLEAHSTYNWLKFISPLVSVTVVGLLIYVLKSNRKCLILFLTNLMLSLVISVVVFPLTCARYAGFIFIGFLVAYWLYGLEICTGRKSHRIVMGLLLMQLIAGVFSISKDIQLPFSNLYKVNEFIKIVPATEKTVTDYWALNAVATFIDKPFHCIDLQKEKYFILWDGDIADMQNTPDRFYSGVKNLFQKEGLQKVYLISLASPGNLYKMDPRLPESFKVTLVDKKVGAIEKGSNLYLYEISKY